jgi:hypothetical protein
MIEVLDSYVFLSISGGRVAPNVVLSLSKYALGGAYRDHHAVKQLLLQNYS